MPRQTAVDEGLGMLRFSGSLCKHRSLTTVIPNPKALTPNWIVALETENAMLKCNVKTSFGGPTLTVRTLAPHDNHMAAKLHGLHY